MMLNWKPLLSNFRSICVVMLSNPTWLLGITGVWFDKTFADAIVVNDVDKALYQSEGPKAIDLSTKIREREIR